VASLRSFVEPLTQLCVLRVGVILVLICCSRTVNLYIHMFKIFKFIHINLHAPSLLQTSSLVHATLFLTYNEESKDKDAGYCMKDPQEKRAKIRERRVNPSMISTKTIGNNISPSTSPHILHLYGTRRFIRTRNWSS
jgi:hypothetical protein